MHFLVFKKAPRSPLPDDWPLYLLCRRWVLWGVEELGFLVVEILPGIHCLVFHIFEKLVYAEGQKRAESRSDPVDPVVSGKRAVDDAGAERTCWVDGAAGEEYAWV